MTQYSAVYQGISGKDVIKQARAASHCHRGINIEFGHTGSIDEYFYSGEDLGPTKPFVDDRYGYCVTNLARHHSICTALQAKGDKIIRITLDSTTQGTGTADHLTLKDFAQAVTDRLVA